jgi:serine/threonine protein kinase
VHRDLNPGNILLDDDFVGLLDFGCACEIDAPRDDRADLSLGLRFGPADLHDPLAVRDGYGPASDLYSLGRHLNRMCRGAYGANPTADPALDMPDRWWAILARLLSTESDRRYADAMAVLVELGPLLADHYGIHPPERPTFSFSMTNVVDLGPRLAAGDRDARSAESLANAGAVLLLFDQATAVFEQLRANIREWLVNVLPENWASEPAYPLLQQRLSEFAWASHDLVHRAQRWETFGISVWLTTILAMTQRFRQEGHEHLARTIVPQASRGRISDRRRRNDENERQRQLRVVTDRADALMAILDDAATDLNDQSRALRDRIEWAYCANRPE